MNDEMDMSGDFSDGDMNTDFGGDISADFGGDLADEIGVDLNEIPVDGDEAPADDWIQDEIIDIPHDESPDESALDIIPFDIQSDYNAVGQEVAEASEALDVKFTQQTDAPYVGEEFHDTITPDDPSTEDRQGTLDNSAVESDNDSRDNNAENIQEWLGDINPNYDPYDLSSAYDNNCGSCAFAVEQRLDGNTDIAASADNIGTTPEMNDATGMEQMPMEPEEIQNYLISQGPGSHGIVGIDRAEGPGHWFNAYYDGEKVVAIDGQTGETQDWPPDYGDVTNWDISVKKEKN
jgi:hypothetical protein